MTNKTNFCAPDKVTNKVTCFSYKALQKIAKIWNNKENQKNNLIAKNIINAKETDTNKQKLWDEIKSKLLTNSSCKEDFCLLDNKHLNGLEDVEIEYETFRPKKPKTWYQDRNTWLSTTDIQHVLLQYENKYPDFEFIGPVPIDFDKKVSVGKCIVDELCNLDINHLYQKGKRQIGIVFNMDEHDKPGSHWVSLFVNMNSGGIYFYDSVGKFPTKEISDLMLRIRNQGNEHIKLGNIPHHAIDDTHAITKKLKKLDNDKYKIITSSKIPKYILGMPSNLSSDKSFAGGNQNITTIEDIDVNNNTITLSGTEETSSIDHKHILIKGFRLFYNDIGHQQKNTECGVYSIHFIESLLNGMSFSDYTKNITRDNEMANNRDRLYRPSK